MLRSIDELLGYKAMASDGDIGHIHDIYFDDQTWMVRYLVVDTGTFLPGRKVLLVPSVLKKPDWESHAFPVDLTQEEIRLSPPIDLAKPVSRQHQIELHEHFGWHLYWLPGAHHWAGHESPPPPKEKERMTEDAQDKGDPHLRSVKEVTGYHIQAYDGEIGRVADFVADDESWHLRFMIVSIRNWFPGKKVFISIGWISDVNWRERKVSVELNKELVRKALKFDPSFPINKRLEERLYDFYGRPQS